MNKTLLGICLLLNMLLSRSLLAQTAAMRAGVVVDAATGQPLPGTTIGGVGIHTFADQLGRYQLPADLPKARFAHVGYADSLVYFQTGKQDTVRLVARHTVLPSVAVRPGTKPRWLVLPGKATAKHRLSMTPGASCAIFFQATGVGYLRSVAVELAQKSPPEGRLRITLVAATAQGQPDLSAPLMPGVVLSHQQLKGKTLRVDLAEANLLLPPEGIFVLVEGLTSQEKEFFVERQDVMLNREAGVSKSTIYTQLHDEAADHIVHRTTAPGHYPALMGMELPTGTSSQVWLKAGQRWVNLSELERAAPPASVFRAYNFDVKLETH